MKNNKYWITSGIEVRHKVFDRNMIVDKIIRRNVAKEGEKPRIFVEGVRCYWLDENGAKHSEVFHTRHLELIKKEE